jgi:excisionase family DNA binding protein
MNNNSSTIQPALLTVRQAAAYLAICERKLWELTKQRRIPAVKIGCRCIRYDVSDLDRFIQAAKEGRTNG